MPSLATFFRSHKQKRKNLVRTRGMESGERKTQKTVPRGAKTYKKQCPQSELIELCSTPGSARRIFFLLLLLFFYCSCCLTVEVTLCVFFKVTDIFSLCEVCAGRPSRRTGQKKMTLVYTGQLSVKCDKI